MFKRIPGDQIADNIQNQCKCSLFEGPRKQPVHSFRFSGDDTARNFSYNNQQFKQKISISQFKKMRCSKNIKTQRGNIHPVREIPIKHSHNSLTGRDIPQAIHTSKPIQRPSQPQLVFRTQRISFSSQVQNVRLPEQKLQPPTVRYFNSVTSIPNKYPNIQGKHPDMMASQIKMLFSFNPQNRFQTPSTSLKGNEPESLIMLRQELAKIAAEPETEESELQQQVYAEESLPLNSTIQQPNIESQPPQSPSNFPSSIAGFRRIESFQSGEKSEDQRTSIVVRHYPVSKLKSPFKRNQQKAINDQSITRMSELSNMFHNQANAKVSQFFDP